MRKTDGKTGEKCFGFWGRLTQRPTYQSESGRFRALLAVSSLHFINDLHPSFLPAFLPTIVRRLSLTHGEAGFLSTLFGIVNLLIQPLAGYLADKVSTPSFALWAPLLTASGAYLLPLAPNYGAAMLFVAMIGVGTANFHPQAHGVTGIAGGSAKLGVYLAVFGAAGTLGAAVSSVYGVFLLRLLGPNLLPLGILLVLGVVLIARSQLPARHGEAGKEGKEGKESGAARAPESFLQNMSRVLLLCMPLVLIAIVRDATSQGIRVFLPLLITERGGSLELGGSVLFAFTLAGSAANLVGGSLADKFGKRRIIVVMLLLAPMFLLPAVRMEGMTSVILFVVGGACIAATNTVTLAMAQERVPDSRSTASSLVMGISWGLANIAASPIGMLADRVGLGAALSLVSLSPLLVVAAMLIGQFRKKSART